MIELHYYIPLFIFSHYLFGEHRAVKDLFGEWTVYVKVLSLSLRTFFFIIN